MPRRDHPVLAALKHVYLQPALRDEILALVAADVNADTKGDRGREGLDDWQILVLAAVRLGCNLDYDKLQDLAELTDFLGRTEQVMDTATRRVLRDEQVTNSEKLFSMFEPHTQLYKPGKASEPVQFGRLVLVYEDGAGFITHHHLLPRDAADRDVFVEQTRIVQQRLGGKIERASFDRGFHSLENQVELAKLVEHPCLPQPGAKQAAAQDRQATVEFRQARQSHPEAPAAFRPPLRQYTTLNAEST